MLNHLKLIRVVRRSPIILILLLLLIASISGANTDEKNIKKENPPTQNWISRENIRAGWIYLNDGTAKIKVFKQVGMNVLLASAGNTQLDRIKFLEWAKESKLVGVHLFAILKFSANAREMGVRCAVFSNGWGSDVACPIDESYWERQISQRALDLAKISMMAEYDISGILIDFELYDNEPKGQPLYYEEGCYCDHCLGSFLKSQGLTIQPSEIHLVERAVWIKKNNLKEKYLAFLQKQVRGLAKKVRASINQINRDIFMGFYPSPNDWMLLGVAQGLGTPQKPMILWTTNCYCGGGAEKIPNNWVEKLRGQQIYAYNVNGLLLRCYSADELAATIIDVSLKGHGYWLFTLHSLCASMEKLPSGYLPKKGTTEDYLREISRANNELNKILKRSSP